MKFYDIVEELQKENAGYIVLVRCGIFFTAIGKDAVILQRLFGLAPVCIKKNVCKCGFPVVKVNKFIDKFKDSGYSYVIYDYAKDGFGSTDKQYKELFKIDGKLYEETKNNLGCEECTFKSSSKSSVNIHEYLSIFDNLKEENKI